MAAATGVDMREVRERAQPLLADAADPDREARIRELAARVAAGEYRVDGAEIVEAALDGDERVLGREERASERRDILRD
jgi:anti-sigma28 factor (negative regulator of flagellin synthesis)